MSELEKYFSTVVKINTADGSGSGLYYKPEDLVVTNFHVISGFRKVGLETQNRDSFPADVVLVNPLLDIAILKPYRVLDVPVIEFQPVKNVKNMDKVSVLGYPYGMPFTVTDGIVSSVKQVLDGQPYIQTDAAINPGNSGGPVLNQKGEVIGIATSKFSEADNMGFALPIDLVKDELDALKANPNYSFAVKCPSCGHSLYEETEHCPNCGVKLEVESIFAEKPKSAIAVFVEEIFGELKIDPVVARRGFDFWEFYQGSALVRYFVFRNDYLFAVSPLVKLPKQNLEGVYAFILSGGEKPFFLGISESAIYISYRVHLSDLNGAHKKEIQDNLLKLALKADELDNMFVEKYGCEFYDEESAKA
ncbi:MAG: trypsin-like peptidase domain-containing protein [Spirochaetes bacterium]|jgi:hypothetical protein|nr:trypsin-like peptidase domain-containing protein [Spirochaetota bacterium]